MFGLNIFMHVVGSIGEKYASMHTGRCPLSRPHCEALAWWSIWLDTSHVTKTQIQIHDYKSTNTVACWSICQDAWCYVTDPSKVVSDQMTSLFLCGHKAQSTPNVISINASVINAIINNASVINTRVTNVIIINTSFGKGIDQDQYRQCIVYIILSPAPGPIVT